MDVKASDKLKFCDIDDVVLFSHQGF